MTEGRWSVERAATWAAERGWQLGCNFIPSSAVNPTEQWQAATFDPATTDRELGWAAGLGMNAVRVSLQYVVHGSDPAGHTTRIDQFLDIAARHGIAVMPVLFDDIAFSRLPPYPGPQREPIPGVHNSGWTPSPGHEVVKDARRWDGPERYARAVVRAFRDDTRILAWDIYNEPGNHGMGESSIPFLTAAFGWVRAAEPVQPLTAGAWEVTSALPQRPGAVEALARVNDAACALSDVISFHSYEGLESLRAQVTALEGYRRPLLCTEWLRRGDYLTEPRGPESLSRMETHVPFFRERNIGCFNWGLVKGRVQTHLSWHSRPGDPDPPLWFHDLLDEAGRPHVPEEAALMRRLSPRRSIAVRL